MKTKNASINWLAHDQLKIEIIDMSRRVLYSTTVDINSKSMVANALTALEKYGVDIIEIAKIIERKRYGEEEDWFRYPLGNR